MLRLELKPLRIVSGWTVYSNRLFDLSSIDLSTINGQKLYKLYYLDEGLLSLRNDNICIYIDWLPANNLEGRYVLTAQNADNLRMEVLDESPDLDDICKKMENWILDVYPNIAVNFLK